MRFSQTCLSQRPMESEKLQITWNHETSEILQVSDIGIDYSRDHQAEHASSEIARGSERTTTCKSTIFPLGKLACPAAGMYNARGILVIEHFADDTLA